VETEVKTEVKKEVTTEVTTETQACEFKAYIGKEGHLVIEATSSDCQKIAIEAVSKKGVDVVSMKQITVKGDEPVTTMIVKQLRPA